MALVGYDIGGTKCAAIVGDRGPDGPRVREKRAFPTPGGWREAMDTLAGTARELLAGERAEAVGISCGSPLSSEKGLILSPPNLPGWDEVPAVELARQAHGAPAFLENDANACALAEWRCGAGRGARSMAFLTCGTGFGAGLILDGRLWRGAFGNAGEIGHTRLTPFGPYGYGKAGSAEGYCSGGGIAQLAELIGRGAIQRGEKPGYPVPGATARDVAIAARAGDPTAREVFWASGEKLGEALALLADIVDPERFVLGSIYARCQDLLEEPMRRALAREALPGAAERVEILPAALGESVGDIAALCIAEYGLDA